MKRVLIVSPHSLSANSAASIRVRCFKETLASKYETKVLSFEEKLLIKPYYNKSRFIIRLLREVLAGVELFVRILFSRNYDFYIFSSPNYFTNFIGALACYLTRRKFSLDIRDIYPQVFFYANLAKEEQLSSKLLLRFSKFLYDKATFITTVTDGLVTLIKQSTQTPVLLVRNGFSKDVSTCNEDQKHKSFSCVFHGTLGHFQDIELLKNLIEKMNAKDSSIKFHVYGDGPQRTILEKITTDNFIFHGNTDHKKLMKEVARFHIGLSFRIDNKITKDAFPVKIYEYIGAQIPTISTPRNCEASTEIDKLNIGKSFNDNEVSPICDYILDLKNNHDSYTELLNQVTKNQENFSREFQSQKLLRYLQEII